MNTSITSEVQPRTEGQEKQLKRVLIDGGERLFDLIMKKLNPDKDGMDRLLGNGDDLVNAIVDAGLEKAREFSMPELYAEEETESSYRYPAEYKGPRPIEEQVKALASIFSLDPSVALAFAKDTLPGLKLPEGAEGWFAIISPSAVLKLFPEAVDDNDRYCKAVSLALEKIAASRRFKNWREGEITPDRLRQHSRTVQGLAKIVETQKGDILIVPAQLGMRHRGRSTRRARVCFSVGEFGLRALDGLTIVLVHPERLKRYDELDMDLPGDEFAPDADGDFSGAPYVNFDDGGARFGTEYVDYANDCFGSGSVVSPQ